MTKLLKNTINKTINSIIICRLFAPDWCSLALHSGAHRSQDALLAVINVLVFGSQAARWKCDMSVRAIDTAWSSLADSPRRKENRSSTSCKLWWIRSHLLIHRQKEQVADCSDFKTDMASGAAAWSYIHPQSN
jgi:hypothetical protein